MMSIAAYIRLGSGDYFKTAFVVFIKKLAICCEDYKRPSFENSAVNNMFVGRKSTCTSPC
jgi:hypothetical protein